jgi:hypothetical protein
MEFPIYGIETKLFPHTSSAFMITHTHRLMRYYDDCLPRYDPLHSPGEETDVIACFMGKNTYLKEKEISHFKNYIIIDYV